MSLKMVVCLFYSVFELIPNISDKGDGPFGKAHSLQSALVPSHPMYLVCVTCLVPPCI